MWKRSLELLRKLYGASRRPRELFRKLFGMSRTISTYLSPERARFVRLEWVGEGELLGGPSGQRVAIDKTNLDLVAREFCFLL
jgi:hypothetical protein